MHIVFCIKYRRKVLNDIISERLKNIFIKIAPKYDIILTDWEHDKDHIRILIRMTPKTEFSKFINAYKSASSRLVKKSFSTLNQCYG
ncbi:IS200/IS605 family transposase [Cetobacterium somerae]|nr:IS200/IS605 family transposase [Cetobacterium sp. NK01]